LRQKNPIPSIHLRKRNETAGKGDFKGGVWRYKENFCDIIEKEP